MKNIGSVIITFNPDIEKLNENIMSIKDQVGSIVIVDNNSQNISDIATQSDKFPRVTLIRLTKNMGIAFAQNEGIKWLENNGYEWVLTLDQDTVVPTNIVDEYIHSKEFHNSETAILSGQYLDDRWSQTVKNKRLDASQKLAVKVNMVIASGNLVRIAAWKAVDGFDDSLFIDWVDYDFNIKLGLAGYDIWRINRVVINHRVGDPIKNQKLKKFLFVKESAILSDYSPIRVYYRQRNQIIFFKRYPKLNKFKFATLSSIISYRYVISYPNKKIRKLFYGLKGIIDGIKYSPKKDMLFNNFLNSLNEKKGEI